jgi:hypothetical protein
MASTFSFDVLICSIIAIGFKKLMYKTTPEKEKYFISPI